MKGLGLEGIYSQTIFYLFLCPFISFFQRSFLLPHNCGEGTPQLWGGFTTIVGKVHHSCGAITIKGLKTTFLLKRTTFKEEKTGVIFGGFCWKWVARGDNFASEKAWGVTIAQTVIGSRARGGRVTPVGRTRLGRGAVEPRARGDEVQGERNDFLRFQEQLLRRKKQELFLGASVGNGLRGGITLQKKIPRNNFNHKLLCSRFFAHESHESTRISLSCVFMATCSVARITRIIWVS